LGLILCRTKEVKKIMVATAISMALMMVSFQISAKSAFFKNYDLTPIGNEIAKDPSRPVAFLGGYNGEFSFLGKIDKPIEIIKGKKPPKEWFKTHPNGLAVVFTRTPDNFKGYTILQSIPYKMTNTYLVIEQKK
jgi:hypothetical protein